MRKPEQVDHAANWVIWTGVLVWAAILSAMVGGPLSHVWVGSATILCGLIAASTIMTAVGSWSLFQAIKLRRKAAIWKSLIGTLMCMIPAGFAAYMVLVVGEILGANWSWPRSITPFIFSLMLCAAYFVPMFYSLRSRLNIPKTAMFGGILFVLVLLAIPLPAVSETWNRIRNPEYWKKVEENRERSRAVQEFRERYPGYSVQIGHDPPEFELRVRNEPLEEAALNWIEEHFEGYPLRINVSLLSEGIEPAAIERLSRLNVVEYQGNGHIGRGDRKSLGPVVEALTHCRNLERLNLIDMGISPADVEAVSRIANLRHLTLRYLIDSDLPPLANLHGLESLEIGSSAITDAGLEHLSGLKNLRSLELWGTRIDGDGLKHLHGLENLEEFELRQRNPIDPAMIELLEAALPGCEIRIKS